MNYFAKFLIFSSFCYVVSGQMLMSLTWLEGNNKKNPLKVDAPYNLYISACSDDDFILRNTFVINGAANTSLYDLKTNKVWPGTGQLQPYLVPDSAYIQTPLSDAQMESLNGVLYLSSVNQVADNNFYIFDICQVSKLNFDGLGAIDLTILFLNTNMEVAPVSSSLISQWSQDGSTRAYIYQGIPYGNIEIKNTQIFSNPMMSDHFYQYFPSVETFSISSVSFYMRTYSGAPSFWIEPGYTNLAGTYTTGFTTTGFYMKPLGVQDAATQINMMRDDHYSGSTGVNILGYSPDQAYVTFDVYKGSEHYNTTVFPGDFFVPWSTPHIGNDFVIWSTCGKNGTYYVQYFVVQGPLINGTTQTPVTYTTPKHIQTTTQASNSLFSAVSLMVLSLILYFL